MKNMKIVNKSFIKRKAKWVERFCLENYGKSLSWISIANKINKCVVENREDDNTIVVDLDKYKNVCGEALEWAETQ